MTEKRISIVVDADGRLAVVALDKTTGAMERLDASTAALRAETTAGAKAAKEGAAAADDLGKAQERTAQRTAQADAAVAELRAEMQQLTQISRRQADFMQRDLSAALGTLIDRTDRAAVGIERMGTSSRRSERDVGLLGRALDEVKGILVAYAGLQGVQAIGRMVDGYADVIGRLDEATSGEAALARAQEQTLRISREYYASLDATATLYARTTSALAEMRVGQEQVAEVVETVNAGLLVGRAGTQESASAILQLSQAFGAGRLSGEEFNAVAEASPQLMLLFADTLDTTRGQLKELAAEGRITSQVMLEALTGLGAEELRQRAEAVPLTISRAWQLAQTNATKYLGDADQSLGVSSAIAQSIRLLSENLDVLVIVGVAAVGLYGGRMAAAVLRSAAAYTGHTIAVVRDTAAQNAQQVALLRSQGLTAAAAARTVALGQAQIFTAGAATRLGAAMTFVGGPIGLAIAAVATLGIAFATTGDDAEASAAQAVNAWRSAKRALDDFNSSPTAGGVDAITDAGVVQQIEQSRARLQELRDEAIEVRDAYSRAIARFGYVDEGLAARLAAANQAVDEQRVRVQALEGAFDGAVRSTADMLQQLAGVSESTPEARQQVEQLADRLLRSGNDMETMRGELTAGIKTIYGVEAAARVAAASFRELSGAMAGADYVGKMQETLRREQTRLVRVTQGNRAASRRELGLAILDEQRKQGRDLTQTELAGMYRAWRDVADATDAADQAQERLRESTRATGREARQEAKDRRQELEAAARAMDSLRAQVRDRGAGLGTAVDRAVADDAREREALDRLERESAATAEVAERNRLLAEARNLQAQAHERALRVAREEDADRQRNLDLVAGGLQALRDEVALAGLSAQRRQVETIVLQAAAKAREQYAQGLRASATLTAEETAALRANAAALIAERDARDGLARLRDSQAEELATLRATVAAGGQLTAVQRAELEIRKALLNATEEQAEARKDEIQQIRDQARELDRANAQRNLQDTLTGVFGRVLDAQQQGTDFWDAFRTEAIRALGDISKSFQTIYKDTKSWKKALGEAGKAAEAALPTLGQIAGTAAGGGGQGAAVGSAIGGIIGGYFGPWGAAIGAVLGGALGGTFDDDPEIRVGPSVNKPEQFRTSRLQTFQVRTESMTDPTSRKVADSIVELDNIVFDLLDNVQRTAVRAALRSFSTNAPTLEDVLVYRFDAVLGALDGRVARFVRASSTNLQTQIQNLGEVLELQRLEGRGELLTGTLERALELIEAFGRAGETAGQTYQRLGNLAVNYGQLMTGVQREITFNGLNEFQQQQVDIELQYRAQVRQANELARAFGLSGARAEDLAQLEQLRAIRMAELQRQMEEERNRVLEDLSLSQLSPLRDDQKLGESMRLLREAVAGGDFERAQELAQQSLTFGRNLYASGRDYNDLYAEVTGLLRQAGMAATEGLTEDRLDDIADLLFDMPENIARALFDLLYAQRPPALNPPGGSTGGGGGSGGGGGGGGGGNNQQQAPPPAEVQTTNKILADILAAARRSAVADEERAALERERMLKGIGSNR